MHRGHKPHIHPRPISHHRGPIHTNCRTIVGVVATVAVASAVSNLIHPRPNHGPKHHGPKGPFRR